MLASSCLRCKGPHWSGWVRSSVVVWLGDARHFLHPSGMSLTWSCLDMCVMGTNSETFRAESLFPKLCDSRKALMKPQGAGVGTRHALSTDWPSRSSCCAALCNCRCGIPTWFSWPSPCSLCRGVGRERVGSGERCNEDMSQSRGQSDHERASQGPRPCFTPRWRYTEARSGRWRVVPLWRNSACSDTGESLRADELHVSGRREPVLNWWSRTAELTWSWRSKWVVVGGARGFTQLARAKARGAVHAASAEQGWRLRWGSILACAAARAVASTMLELRGPHSHGFGSPVWSGELEVRAAWRFVVDVWDCLFSAICQKKSDRSYACHAELEFENLQCSKIFPSVFLSWTNLMAYLVILNSRNQLMQLRSYIIAHHVNL